MGESATTKVPAGSQIRQTTTLGHVYAPGPISDPTVAKSTVLHQHQTATSHGMAYIDNKSATATVFATMTQGDVTVTMGMVVSTVPLRKAYARSRIRTGNLNTVSVMARGLAITRLGYAIAFPMNILDWTAHIVAVHFTQKSMDSSVMGMVNAYRALMKEASGQESVNVVMDGLERCVMNTTPPQLWLSQLHHRRSGKPLMLSHKVVTLPTHAGISSLDLMGTQKADREEWAMQEIRAAWM